MQLKDYKAVMNQAYNYIRETKQKEREEFKKGLQEVYDNIQKEKMELQIDLDDLNWKIQEAYDEEDYEKANQLLGIKEKMFPDED